MKDPIDVLEKITASGWTCDLQLHEDSAELEVFIHNGDPDFVSHSFFHRCNSMKRALENVMTQAYDKILLGLSG